MCGPIAEAKTRISILEAADRLCEGGAKRRGSGYVARCPVPGHPDEDPSCKLDVDEGRWYCFVCNRGGDVVDMYATANGYENQGEAAGFLLLEFGYEIPERPASWHRKQSRQQKIRDRIDAEKIEHIRLLVFRLVWTSWLARLPESVRTEAAEGAWRESLPLARMLYEQRRGA